MIRTRTGFWQGKARAYERTKRQEESAGKKQVKSTSPALAARAKRLEEERMEKAERVLRYLANKAMELQKESPNE